MSPRGCPPVEQLAELAALPLGDARRAHVDACPRCLGMLASYALFMEGRAAEGARPEEADAVLAAAFERELGPAVRAVQPRAEGGSWFTRLFAPSLRPAWAFAALALVAFAAWQFTHAPGAPLMRGGDVSLVRVETLPPQASAAALRLRWQGVTSATAYEVHFYRLDLAELASVPSPTTALTLQRGALPANLPAHARVMWQVVALAGRDELARSRPQPVDLP